MHSLFHESTCRQLIRAFDIGGIRGGSHIGTTEHLKVERIVHHTYFSNMKMRINEKMRKSTAKYSKND